MKKIKIGFWQTLDFQNNTEYFFKSKKEDILGEDPIITLQSLFSKSIENNFHIEFVNKNFFFDYDILIFCNYPENKNFSNMLKQRKKNYLLAVEGPTIDSSTWDKDNHKYFDKIFTWHDALVDNHKYFKVNFPSYEINFDNLVKVQNKKNFLNMICSNKENDSPNDLYSVRKRFINWAEKKNYNNFHLYGYGWKSFTKFKILNRILNRLSKKFTILNNLKSCSLRSYRGEIKTLKSEVLKNYKFSICFENANNYEGYITEKIFHCFFSYCVPIYLGASNISEHVPSNCFINFEDFKTFDDLVKYLEEMSKDDYELYLKSIDNFIRSNNFKKKFGMSSFSNVIFNEIKKDILSLKNDNI